MRTKKSNFVYIGEIAERRGQIEEVIALLDGLGVPINRSVEFKYSRAKSYLGMCMRLKNGERKFRILLNKSAQGEAFENIVIHELLHTIKIKDGHRGKWKAYATLVNENTNYHITRIAKPESAGKNV